MLTNAEVIAIDQDPLGIQGTPSKRDRDAEVWAKPLAGGECAVALLNRVPTRQHITTDAIEIGLPPANAFRVRDVWTQSTSRTPGAIRADVPPHSAVLYRVMPTDPR